MRVSLHDIYTDDFRAIKDPFCDNPDKRRILNVKPPSVLSCSAVHAAYKATLEDLERELDAFHTFRYQAIKTQLRMRALRHRGVSKMAVGKRCAQNKMASKEPSVERQMKSIQKNQL